MYNSVTNIKIHLVALEKMVWFSSGLFLFFIAHIVCMKKYTAYGLCVMATAAPKLMFITLVVSVGSLEVRTSMD